MDKVGDRRKDRSQRDASDKAESDRIVQPEDIFALTAMAQALRDDAIELGLTFEGYLLDMAVTALHERAQK